VIACPPGGRELAHQIVNNSSDELVYLSVSTKLSPEIAEYPDSGKFGVLSSDIRFLGKLDQSLGYWDGSDPRSSRSNMKSARIGRSARSRSAKGHRSGGVRDLLL